MKKLLIVVVLIVGAALISPPSREIILKPLRVATGGGQTGLDARLVAELIKWMFLFWLGTVATMLGIGRLLVV